MNKKELEENYGVDLSFEPREMICKNITDSVGCKCFVASYHPDQTYPFKAIDSNGSPDTYKYAEDLPDYEPPLKMGDKIEAGFELEAGFDEAIFIKHGCNNGVIVVDPEYANSFIEGSSFNTSYSSVWHRIKPMKITLKVNGEDKELSELSEKEKEYIKNNL